MDNFINDIDNELKHYTSDINSAGICDNCSVVKLIYTGNGIDGPYDPTLYCDKMNIEICPSPPKDRIYQCTFYKEKL